MHDGGRLLRQHPLHGGSLRVPDHVIEARAGLRAT
jgi:hypothetical protein